MPVRGIRGATTVEADDPAEVTAATRELLERLTQDNGVAVEEVAGVWFTTTADIRSEFPAVAARQLGWVDVPLLCGREMEVAGGNARSIPRCIRVLLLVNTELAQGQVRAAYLRGARTIKAELDRARSGALAPDAG